MSSFNGPEFDEALAERLALDPNHTTPIRAVLHSTSMHILLSCRLYGNRDYNQWFSRWMATPTHLSPVLSTSPRIVQA